MYSIHYNYREDLLAIRTAIQSFTLWSSNDDLRYAVSARHDIFTGNRHHFNLRSSIEFPGLKIVIFKERFEFQFSHDITKQLMLFIGEYYKP